MNYVAPRGVSVVRGLFVMSGIVVLGRLLVVVGGMRCSDAFLWCSAAFFDMRLSPRQFQTLRLLRPYDTHQDDALHLCLETVRHLAASLGKFRHDLDPPPLKWSDLRYVFDIQEDCNGKEAIQA